MPFVFHCLPPGLPFPGLASHLTLQNVLAHLILTVSHRRGFFYLLLSWAFPRASSTWFLSPLYRTMSAWLTVEVSAPSFQLPFLPIPSEVFAPNGSHTEASLSVVATSMHTSRYGLIFSVFLSDCAQRASLPPVLYLTSLLSPFLVSFWDLLPPRNCPIASLPNAPPLLFNIG